MSESSKYGNWKLIVLNLAFWLAFTTIASSLYFLSFGENYEGGWWNFFWRQFPIWMFWSVFSIPIYYLIRVLRKNNLSFWNQVIIHFIFLGILFLCFYVFFIGYSLYLSGEEVSLKAIFQTPGSQFILNYIVNVLIYLLVITFVYGWFWYQDLQQSRVEKSRIQAQLHEARLNMLTAQLHPHFLFNALNSISGLMRKKENQKAITAMADLGQLLRWSLEYQPSQFIPLKLELDFIEHYLKMEQLRFGDNLSIHFDVASDLESVSIPALILQPLVENTIKHGIYKSSKKRTLQIKITKDTRFVSIAIINDCSEELNPGIFENQKGLGIQNVKERLRTIYSGREYVFEVGLIDSNKVSALLKLPL
ncbi:MAG: histidine kinase [Bacteroidota bacterium]